MAFSVANGTWTLRALFFITTIDSRKPHKIAADMSAAIHQVPTHPIGGISTGLKSSNCEGYQSTVNSSFSGNLFERI